MDGASVLVRLRHTPLVLPVKRSYIHSTVVNPAVLKKCSSLLLGLQRVKYECNESVYGCIAGARIAMTAMQPGRIPLYLMNGNVLRVAHPGQCYVEEDEDMVDCGLQFLQVWVV